MRTCFLAMWVLCVLAAACGADEAKDSLYPDKLRPEADSKRAIQFQTLFRKAAKAQPDYAIEVEEIKWGREGTKMSGILYRYHVKVPAWMKEYMKTDPVAAGDAMWLAQLHRHLHEPDCSFDAAVLTLATRVASPQRRTIEPLLSNNRASWRQDHEKYASLLISQATGQVSSRRYQRELFLGLLDRRSRERLNVGKEEFSTSAWALEGSITSDGAHRTAAFDAMARFLRGDVTPEDQDLKGFGNDSRSLMAWSLFLLNAEEQVAARYTTHFARAATLRSDTAEMTSWLNALLVARGYEHDATTGKYALNPVGQEAIRWLIKQIDNDRTREIISHLHEHGEARFIDSIVRTARLSAQDWPTVLKRRSSQD